MSVIIITPEVYDHLLGTTGDIVLNIMYDNDTDVIIFEVLGQCYTEAFESQKKYIEDNIGPITDSVEFEHFGEPYTSFKCVMIGKKVSIVVE